MRGVTSLGVRARIVTLHIARAESSSPRHASRFCCNFEFAILLTLVFVHSLDNFSLDNLCVVSFSSVGHACVWSASRRYPGLLCKQVVSGHLFTVSVVFQDGGSCGYYRAQLYCWA